jgi:hypothetical protein
VAGCCEHGNEPSGSIKGGEFDWLNDCQLLKRDLVSYLVVQMASNQSTKSQFYLLTQIIEFTLSTFLL